MSLETILPNKLNPTPLVTCDSSTSIHEVSRLMAHHNVGCVVVAEKGIPQGIITDRDILVRVVAQAPDLTPGDPVRVAMSSPVKTIHLYQGLHEALKTMKESKIRRLPVVNSLGVVVGILTFSDLLTLLTHELSDMRDIILAETGFEFGKLAA